MTDLTVRDSVVKLIAGAPQHVSIEELTDTVFAHVGARILEHAGEWNGNIYAGVSRWPDGEAHGYGTAVDEILELLGQDIPKP